ncbi:MAG: hypothetical protein GXX09_01365 [Syntrophomonadaceae bacterium]|nr:hypothetical protein [Syntrophomonadaceae bacterium]
MENPAFLYTLINKLFLAASETLQEVPGGDVSLENIIENLSRRVFDEFKRDYYPRGTSPKDFATAWIRVLGKQGFLAESHYEFVEEGDNLKVAIFNGSCAYREYCHQAEREGILFICPRMTSIKWVIARSLEKPYRVTPEAIIHSDVCVGTIHL